MEQIITGTFEVDPADREAFLASRDEAIRRSRDEPGCIVYVLAPDPLEPGRVVLFERWANEEALEAHRLGMQASPPAAGGVPILRREILRFSATETPFV